MPGRSAEETLRRPSGLVELAPPLSGGFPILILTSLLGLGELNCLYSLASHPGHPVYLLMMHIDVYPQPNQTILRKTSLHRAFLHLHFIDHRL